MNPDSSGAGAHAAREIERGMTATSKRLPAGSRIPWHDHGRPTLCVVYSGEVLEEDSSTTRSRPVGDLVFRARAQPHRNRNLGRASRLLCLEVERDALHDLGASALLEREAPVVVTSPRVARLARLAEPELWHPNDMSRLRLLAISYDLLAIAGSVGPRRRRVDRPRWLDAVETFMGETPLADVTTAGLAGAAGLDLDRFAREFRRHFGTSARTWLRGRRLDHALHQLAETTRSLAEIALLCGFYDQSHFTRSFKQALGCTPGEFRRRST